MTDLRTRLEAELQRMFDSAEWGTTNSGLKHYTDAELSGLASEIADKVFSDLGLLTSCSTESNLHRTPSRLKRHS